MFYIKALSQPFFLGHNILLILFLKCFNINHIIIFLTHLYILNVSVMLLVLSSFRILESQQSNAAQYKTITNSYQKLIKIVRGKIFIYAVRSFGVYIGDILITGFITGEVRVIIHVRVLSKFCGV